MTKISYPSYASAYSDKNHFIFVHQTYYRHLNDITFYPYMYRCPNDNTIAIFKVKPKKSA